MSKVLLSKELQADFLRDELIEVCDENGQQLGWVRRYDPMEDCPYTEEEMAEARKQKGGRPLADIWRDLEAQAG